MSQKCPQCSAAVEHDFGMTSCAKCGVILFVDFDGQVQASTPEMQAEPFVATPSEWNEEAELSAAETEPLENIHIPAPPPELIAAAEAEAVATEDGEYSDLRLDEESWQGDSGETVYLTQQPGDSVTNSGLVDFSDVVDFANSSELDNSSLVYTLRIEGIDHRDVRRKVETVLAEPRLNFHLRDILPQIRGGVLELRDLTPIRTSFIASRLREESVEFRWKQSVYDSNSDSATDARPEQATGTDN